MVISTNSEFRAWLVNSQKREFNFLKMSNSFSFLQYLNCFEVLIIGMKKTCFDDNMSKKYIILNLALMAKCRFQFFFDFSKIDKTGSNWLHTQTRLKKLFSPWCLARLSMLISMSSCNATIMHMQCTCTAHVIHMQCTCNAPTMQIQCSCYAPAMPKQISLIFGIKMEKGEKVRGNEAEQWLLKMPSVLLGI